MQLPALDQVQSDPFLYRCWQADRKGIYNPKVNANTRFLDRRRLLTAFYQIKRHLSPEPIHQRLADFACGTGTMGVLWVEQGYKVDFVDNEKRFFNYIQKKLSHVSSFSASTRFIHRGIHDDRQSRPETYDAIYLGEALEHMAKPDLTLRQLWRELKPGGLLSLTTPNGDFVGCYERNWTDVKDQWDRNEKIANTISNHVCEFTVEELQTLLKEAGFGIVEHEVVCSSQVSKRHLLRLLPERWVWPLDRLWSKKVRDGKTFGRTQVVLAQKLS